VISTEASIYSLTHFAEGGLKIDNFTSVVKYALTEKPLDIKNSAFESNLNNGVTRWCCGQTAFKPSFDFHVPVAHEHELASFLSKGGFLRL